MGIGPGPPRTFSVKWSAKREKMASSMSLAVAISRKRPAGGPDLLADVLAIRQQRVVDPDAASRGSQNDGDPAIVNPVAADGKDTVATKRAERHRGAGYDVEFDQHVQQSAPRQRLLPAGRIPPTATACSPADSSANRRRRHHRKPGRHAVGKRPLKFRQLFRIPHIVLVAGGDDAAASIADARLEIFGGTRALVVD